MSLRAEVEAVASSAIWTVTFAVLALSCLLLAVALVVGVGREVGDFMWAVWP